MNVADLASRIAALLRGSDGRGVVAVYLFGSHATGRAHRESDLDVGVVLRHDEFPTAAARFEAGLRLHGLMSAAGERTPVDLVVLNDAPPGLAAAVVTTGRCLVCLDAEAEHAFRRDAQLRAADLEPFLRRAALLKRQAIAR